MSAPARVVQTGPQAFVVRCPVHGDVSAHPSSVAASLACLVHMAFAFHGEGAR